MQRTDKKKQHDTEGDTPFITGGLKEQINHSNIHHIGQKKEYEVQGTWHKPLQ
ncbi:MAG: hypothetical protein HC905_12125 [Bacteroidales bacterium]|nr:hypothetical protein [Bacteroidales bacterium]